MSVCEIEAGLVRRMAQGYRDLFQDARLFAGFEAALSGILASGSTRVRKIVRAAPQTSHVPHAERRLRRLVAGDNQRANVQADVLGARLTEQGAQRLAAQAEVIGGKDGSDLRKPHSQQLEYLATVRALDGDPVSGYPTLNAIGLAGDGTRALLYHTTYSPLASGFRSENAQVHAAIRAIVAALRRVGVGRLIFVLDRGFDDLKLIKLLTQLNCGFVIRAQHIKRKSRLQPTSADLFLQNAVQSEVVLERFEMRRPSGKPGKARWKLTPAQVRAREVYLDDGRIRVNVVKLDFNVPRGDADQQGWLLLTNLSTDGPGQAGQIVRLYLRRWSVEDVFSWTKDALGWRRGVPSRWEQVRLLDFAWIAASFVFALGETLDSAQVQLLAHLGGYVPHKNRPPGKKVVLAGLQQLAAALCIKQYNGRSQHPFDFDTLADALFSRL